MAKMPPLPRIIQCNGKRCIVVPPGEWAELELLEDGSEKVSMSPGCTVTEDGYPVPPLEPLWPGWLPERLHPWPPHSR